LRQGHRKTLDILTPTQANRDVLKDINCTPAVRRVWFASCQRLHWQTVLSRETRRPY